MACRNGFSIWRPRCLILLISIKHVKQWYYFDYFTPPFYYYHNMFVLYQYQLDFHLRVMDCFEIQLHAKRNCSKSSCSTSFLSQPFHLHHLRGLKPVVVVFFHWMPVTDWWRPWFVKRRVTFPYQQSQFSVIIITSCFISSESLSFNCLCHYLAIWGLCII